MSNFPLIADNLIRVVHGVRYRVRKFGFDGAVLEEEYVPLPKVKTITFFNEDGTVNEDLSTVEYLTNGEE